MLTQGTLPARISISLLLFQFLFLLPSSSGRRLSARDTYILRKAEVPAKMINLSVSNLNKLSNLRTFVNTSPRSIELRPETHPPSALLFLSPFSHSSFFYFTVNTIPRFLARAELLLSLSPYTYQDLPTQFRLLREETHCGRLGLRTYRYRTCDVCDLKASRLSFYLSFFGQARSASVAASR